MFIIRTQSRDHRRKCYLVKGEKDGWIWTSNLTDATEFNGVKYCDYYIKQAGKFIARSYSYPEAIDANILWHEEQLKENRI